MAPHLLLRLEAPLMSFGGDTIDAYGVVRDFPARSMLAGLIGNALGYERHEGHRLDQLQARLICGAVRLREGTRIRDFQTAKLEAADKGWTTRGRPEGRAGGAGTYQSPHIRYRDADADALVLVALRLDPAEEAPMLHEVAAALDRPERPLFLGRKPFLPSRPLGAGIVAADDVRAALELGLRQAVKGPNPIGALASCRAQWPAGEGRQAQTVRSTTADERDWRAQVHAGQRDVVEGRLETPA